jgi:DNA polymerase III alpha subunit
MQARKIKKISSVGKIKMMDIEVSNRSHVFYGNGIATSNSHAVAYAVASCKSASMKFSYPKEFFLSYLYYANEKQDPHQEVYELISEAKIFDIEVKLPKISCFTEKFSIVGDCIQFGIKDVKSLSDKAGDQVLEAVNATCEQLGKKPDELSWMDILIIMSPKIKLTAFNALCSMGFFSTPLTMVSRNRALYEYSCLRQLTKAELKWIQDKYQDFNWKNLVSCLESLQPTKKMGGGTSTASRSQSISNEIQMLKNPPFSLDDDPSWIIEMEKSLLGCPVSLCRVDAIDTSLANTTCKEIIDGKRGKNICVVGNLTRVSNFKIKNKQKKSYGKTMCFLTIEDSSGMLDNVCVFPESREKYQYILYEGNNLMFCGEVDDQGGLIVETVHEI